MCDVFNKSSTFSRPSYDFDSRFLFGLRLNEDGISIISDLQSFVQQRDLLPKVMVVLEDCNFLGMGLLIFARSILDTFTWLSPGGLSSQFLLRLPRPRLRRFVLSAL
jgi:hypothetical protein